MKSNGIVFKENIKVNVFKHEGVEIQHHIFLTWALGCGYWSDSAPATLPPKIKPAYPFSRRVGGEPESIWALIRREKCLPLPAIESPLLGRLVPSRYAEHAGPAPNKANIALIRLLRVIRQSCYRTSNWHTDVVK
jgi:hypothetical protein